MKKEKILTIAEIILFGFAVILGLFNLKHNPDFLYASAAQILTLVIAIVIAFWATQAKNDERKAKEQIEKVVGKLQTIVSSDEFFSFEVSENTDLRKKNHAMMMRKISNYIDVLYDYAKAEDILNEVDYIANEFNAYKGIVSEKINDFKYLSESETILRKYSENIDSKCDKVISKIYSIR